MSIVDLKDSNYAIVRESDYFIEGNKVMFYDKAAGTTIKVYYNLRPGKLIQTEDCTTVGSETSGVITAGSTIPSTYTLLKTYDFIKANAGFDALGIGKAISAVDSTTMTFASTDVPAGLAAGDYICLADESPVPQIPIEFFPYLSQLTAIQILEGIGDYENASKLESKLPEMKHNALSMIAPRVKNRSKPITSSDYSRYRTTVSD
jgi:hypothetical protein